MRSASSDVAHSDDLRFLRNSVLKTVIGLTLNKSCKSHCIKAVVIPSKYINNDRCVIHIEVLSFSLSKFLARSKYRAYFIM